jgi:hypothetical protein
VGHGLDQARSAQSVTLNLFQGQASNREVLDPRILKQVQHDSRAVGAGD